MAFFYGDGTPRLTVLGSSSVRPSEYDAEQDPHLKQFFAKYRSSTPGPRPMPPTTPPVAFPASARASVMQTASFPESAGREYNALDDPHLRQFLARPAIQRRLAQNAVRSAIAAEESDPWMRLLTRIGNSITARNLQPNAVPQPPLAAVRELCGCSESGRCPFCQSKLSRDAMLMKHSVRAALAKVVSASMAVGRPAATAATRAHSPKPSRSPRVAPTPVPASFGSPLRNYSAKELGILPKPPPPPGGQKRRMPRPTLVVSLRQASSAAAAASRSSASPPVKRKPRMRRSTAAAVCDQHHQAALADPPPHHDTTAHDDEGLLETSAADHGAPRATGADEPAGDSDSRRVGSDERALAESSIEPTEPLITGRQLRATCTLQSWWRGVSTRAVLSQWRCAAIRIQAAVRERQFKVALERAARTIQAACRGSRMRLRLSHHRCRIVVERVACALQSRRWMAELKAQASQLAAFGDEARLAEEERENRRAVVATERSWWQRCALRATDSEACATRLDLSHACDRSFDECMHRKAVVVAVSEELVKLEREQEAGRNHIDAAATAELAAVSQRAERVHFERQLEDEPRRALVVDETFERSLLVQCVAVDNAHIIPLQWLRSIEAKARSHLLALRVPIVRQHRDEYTRLRLSFAESERRMLICAVELSERGALLRAAKPV